MEHFLSVCIIVLAVKYTFDSFIIIIVIVHYVVSNVLKFRHKLNIGAVAANLL